MRKFIAAVAITAFSILPVVSAANVAEAKPKAAKTCIVTHTVVIGGRTFIKTETVNCNA